MQEKLEITALFLRLGQPSTLIRNGNRSFTKPRFKKEEFETSTAKVFLNYKSKITSDCYVFKFLRRRYCGWKTFDAVSWNFRPQILLMYNKQHIELHISTIWNLIFWSTCFFVSFYLLFGLRSKF